MWQVDDKCCQRPILRLVMITYCAIRLTLPISLLDSLYSTERPKEQNMMEGMLMIIVGGVAGGLLILMLIIIIAITCHHKRKNTKLERELTERK